jgi:hypothetical protein
MARSRFRAENFSSLPAPGARAILDRETLSSGFVLYVPVVEFASYHQPQMSAMVWSPSASSAGTLRVEI